MADRILDDVRKALGAALFVGGGLVLAFAFGRYAVGAAQADGARSAWDDHQAREAVTLAEASASHRWRPAFVATGAPVAHLVIPRLGLDEIVLEGIDGDELNAGPGHYPGSAFPGESGNAIISAHRDRHFNRLEAIAVGDTIQTESGEHTTTWIVVSKRVVQRDQPALFATKTPRLTLTTCWPIRYFGPAPDRLIVTAEPTTTRAGTSVSN